jgi:hypothetical protein
LRKAAEFVRGRTWVCGRAPAPGATGTAAVGEACGAALRVGVAVWAGVADDDDTADDPVTLALAVVAGDDGAGGLPHPVSRTPASEIHASRDRANRDRASAGLAIRIASGACRDNLMPPTPPRPCPVF